MNKDAKEKLIRAAKTLFAKQGLDATTVREIAAQAEVNVSLVSYHFKGKEGLYRTCLEQFGKERLAVAQKFLQPPSSKEEFILRLEMFVSEMLDSTLGDPELIRIIHREFDMGSSIAEDIFKNSFQKVFETLIAFLQSAKDSGLIRDDVDPRLSGYFFFGAITNISRTGALGPEFFGIKKVSDQKNRAAIAKHILNIYLCGATGTDGKTRIK